MRLSISLSPLFGLALASPSGRSSSGSPSNPSFDSSAYDNWQPAGPGDLRSPCPWMNSFANHNFLPHDGRNITIPLMKETFKKFANVGPDVAETLGTTALGIVGPGATSFTLQDIDAHNVIEHDGSLSRSDFALGDDHDFNYTYFGEAAAYFHKPTINITDAADARFARMTTMMKVNPDFNLTTAGFTGSFVEQSFYLSIFGDPYTGIAQSDWVLEWFYAERLPTFIGWTPRVQETNLTTLTAMAKLVMAATPDTVVPPDSDFFLGH